MLVLQAILKMILIVLLTANAVLLITVMGLIHNAIDEDEEEITSTSAEGINPDVNPHHPE